MIVIATSRPRRALGERLFKRSSTSRRQGDAQVDDRRDQRRASATNAAITLGVSSFRKVRLGTVGA